MLLSPHLIRIRIQTKVFYDTIFSIFTTEIKFLPNPYTAGSDKPPALQKALQT
jgi:hypothetical protein